MRNSTKRLLSFALAGTIITGVAPMKASAETNSKEVVQEEVVEEKQPITYTVKKGDTLGNICKKFFGSDVHYPYLAAFNNIEDPSLIYPGQVLYIPDSLAELMTVESPKECEEDKTYTVQTGDTLYCIVRVQYGLTNQEAVDKLATYNGLSDPNRISKGQVLKIPCKEKLLEVNQNDYTAEYNRMGWILNHPKKPECPGEWHPDWHPGWHPDWHPGCHPECPGEWHPGPAPGEFCPGPKLTLKP